MLCAIEGVSHEFYTPSSPYKVGIFERKNHTFQEMVKVMHYAIEHLIGFPYLISRFLINQKHDTVFTEDEKGVPLSLLNLNYKLFVGKHVLDIVLPKIPHLTSLICLLVEMFLMSCSCMGL